MPGIAGIIRKTPHEGIDFDLQLMVEAMRNGTQYTGRQYVNRELGLYVGWMNLHGSFSDCMPLVNRQDDIVLIFQGENFLDDESRSRLKRFGKGGDDANARYLMDLYREFGESFFLHLNGWFSGVIADLRKRRVTLFNDRFGMGRIYIHEGKDEFIFGSQAKSLLKVRPNLRSIEVESLAEHLRYNCVTKGKTLFKGISLLPPASCWDFEESVLPKRRHYFHFSDWEKQPALEPNEFYQTFSETVSRVFPRYARGANPVAFSLTAGLDTRMIAAALQENNRSVPCYTFGGAWGELFDVSVARKIAKVYDQPFEAITIGDRFLTGFPEFARRTIYISDGTHDAFGAHDVYFNETARKIAPIRLTGKFGSEVVRTRKLIPSLTYQSGLLQPNLASLVEGLPSYADINPNGHPLTRVVCQEIPWHEFGRVAIEQSEIALRTPYMDNELVKLMYQAPSTVRAAGRVQEQYVRDKSRELSNIATNMGKFACDNQLITRLLYGAAWALFKIEYIYLFATPHWLTRVDRTLAKLRLEKILSGRQKWEGYRLWIKTHFSEFIQDTLLNSQANYTRHFEKTTVERMVRGHVAGTHNYLNEINRALTVELIYSTLLNP
jgi:asparagine synthase (glutamine-hydrolysing)